MKTRLTYIFGKFAITWTVLFARIQIDFRPIQSRYNASNALQASFYFHDVPVIVSQDILELLPEFAIAKEIHRTIDECSNVNNLLRKQVEKLEEILVSGLVVNKFLDAFEKDSFIWDSPTGYTTVSLVIMMATTIAVGSMWCRRSSRDIGR
jgi:hypothetical protein